MSPQNDDAIEQRLKELETQISIQHIPRSAKPEPNRFQLSYSKLKKVAKATVFVVTGLVGVWIFGTVVSFVSIILGLAIAGGVAYVGYKLFLNRDNYR